MALNQLHGKRFEDFVKASGYFLGSCDSERSSGAQYDIEAKFDLERGLATSVKTTKSGSIGFGDARRTWTSICGSEFRLLVGVYAQFTNRKVFGELHEIIIKPDYSHSILGDVSYAEVEAFHDAISLANFPDGQHNKARELAKAMSAALKPRLGIMALNPKIDSGTQRRLQCSLDLEDLTKIVRQGGGEVRLHEMHFADLPLPLAVRSSARFLA